MINYNIECEICHTTYTLRINPKHWKRYIAGELIQDALTELNDGERELLISGTCNKCYAHWIDPFEKVVHDYNALDQEGI